MAKSERKLGCHGHCCPAAPADLWHNERRTDSTAIAQHSRCRARASRHEEIRRLSLRGTLDGHNRQVPAPGMEGHVELDRCARLASHQGPRTRTRRSKRPTLAQLETWCAIGREAFHVDLIRRATVEGRMRPVFIVPVDRELNLATEGCGSKWHPRYAA